MTYNQAKFIRQALDGFVMQKTNFPFEVIVHDDASTDGTTDIIREYAEKYPDIIKPIIQTENQWVAGGKIWLRFIWPAIHGEYVAVCDGDDYWTDPNKLQKQADFLDNNPDYSICFHTVSGFFEDGSAPDFILEPGLDARDINLHNLLWSNFIANCSVMYRWINPIKEWPCGVYPGDWFLHLLHAKHGQIKYIPETMARYRRHKGGVSFASEYGADALHLQWGIQEMMFFTNAEKLIAPDKEEYHTYLIIRARQIINAYLSNQEFDKAAQILQMCPDLLSYQPHRAQSKKWQRRFNYLLIFTVVSIIALICSLLLII